MITQSQLRVEICQETEVYVRGETQMGRHRLLVSERLNLYGVTQQVPPMKC